MGKANAALFLFLIFFLATDVLETTGLPDSIIFLQSLSFEEWHSACCLFQIAELVAAEFFDQGDRERKELNIEPAVSKRLCW